MSWLPPVNRRTFLRTATLATGAMMCGSAAAAATQKITRVGIVGLGQRGSRHLATYRSTPGVLVTALCDSDERRLRRAAQSLAGQVQRPTCFNDPEALLDGGGVDALSITTPDHLHASLAQAASRRGWHVFVESPCVHSLSDMTALVDLAATATPIVVDGLHAEAPGAAERLLGRVTGRGRVFAAAEICCGLPANAAADWRTNLALGSGRWAAVALEPLDLARRVLGVELPEEVHCIGDGTPAGFLRADLWFRTETGASRRISVQISPRFQDQPTLRFFGAHGGFTLPGPQNPHTSRGRLAGVAMFASAAATASGEGLTSIRDGAYSGALVHVVNAAASLKRPLSLTPAGHPIHDDEAAALLWTRRRK